MKTIFKKPIHSYGSIQKIFRNYQLYLFLLPTLAYFIIFKYIPMYGVQIAFKDYISIKGFWGSPWIGFANFERFFNSVEFWNTLKNTLGLSVLQLTAGFPMPVILALMLNQVSKKRFRKIAQTAVYAPHFISTVVMAGMVYVFLAPKTGIINLIINALGGDPIFFMGKPEWFKPIYVLSSIWQHTGWEAIIFIAALTSIPQELYESAKVDGASKLQRILYIDIPGIMPTAIVLLILNVGNVMSIGFEKAFLMQNDLNRVSSEIIATYVYKAGLQNAQYSFSSAVGLFNSLINLILLFTANRIAKKVSDISLW